MAIKKTLGGDRLGAGQKMQVDLHPYGRSTFNQGSIKRLDMGAGPLVPVECNIGLDGTTFEYEINTRVRTLPTVGPVFGSFKMQVDMFKIPIRLYIAALHNNELGIGMNMKNVKLPVIQYVMPKWKSRVYEKGVANDSLFAYLGKRSQSPTNSATTKTTTKQALFELAYLDIFKNYYSNKQEEKFMIMRPLASIINRVTVSGQLGETNPIAAADNASSWKWDVITNIVAGKSQVNIYTEAPISEQEARSINIYFYDNKAGYLVNWKAFEWELLSQTNDGNLWNTSFLLKNGNNYPNQPSTGAIETDGSAKKTLAMSTDDSSTVAWAPLSDIDEMRKKILAASGATPFNITDSGVPTYAWLTRHYKQISPIRTLSVLEKADTIAEADALFESKEKNAMMCSQNGLVMKTYLSDMYTNWISTEWVDGVNGINEITAVKIEDNKFTMDALILQKKIFNVLNRIATSGGSYRDWREAVYGVKTEMFDESPIYVGGMSTEITFAEVVSNSAAEDQPLGSLAGRGQDNENAKKGGKIKIRCNEPSLIMAICSITPRVDYSEPNKWWTNLETMDDFHKPGLDAIGWQDLLVEDVAAGLETNEGAKRAIGKQPSWIEYQTAVNETFGSFAAGESLSFMALNRTFNNGGDPITTAYIDPRISSNIFADTTADAKNFWVQLAFDCKARRVMSAKQIPNL